MKGVEVLQLELPTVLEELLSGMEGFNLHPLSFTGTCELATTTFYGRYGKCARMHQMSHFKAKREDKHRVLHIHIIISYSVVQIMMNFKSSSKGEGIQA